jgi:hypothetical protein
MLSVAVHGVIIGAVVSLMVVMLRWCRDGCSVRVSGVRFGFTDRRRVSVVMGVLCHDVLLQ